ncbi:S-acyltransferase [Psidium guajava]|nr:S-acyltransferase [Psidium guajava]
MSFLFVKGHVELTVSEENERTCWGCGLCLLLPSNAPIFKCGWCGAITNQRTRKQKDKSLWWRRWRDRCFVSVVSLFMLFILGKLLNQLSLASG